MQKRIATMAAFGVVLGLVLASSVGASGGANSSEVKRTTYLTFSQPIGLPGVTLPAGTYIFERADPLMSIDVIRVTNPKRNQVYFTAFTERVERQNVGRGEASVVFTPPQEGRVRRIVAWYPNGGSMGHEFIYR